MQQLLDEVSLASHQLVQVQQLAAECKTLRDTPEGRGKGRDTGGLPGQTEGGNAPSRLVTDGGIPSEQTVEGEALSPGEEVLSRSRTPSVSSVASENGDRLAPRRKAKSLLTSKRWVLTSKQLLCHCVWACPSHSVGVSQPYHTIIHNNDSSVSCSNVLPLPLPLLPCTGGCSQTV